MSPVQGREIILGDIFGGKSVEDKGCRYDCESREEYDRKFTLFKKKWDEIEKQSTMNNPLSFTKYFTTYKESQIRDKMAKYVRDKAGMSIFAVFFLSYCKRQTLRSQSLKLPIPQRCKDIRTLGVINFTLITIRACSKAVIL